MSAEANVPRIEQAIPDPFYKIAKDALAFKGERCVALLDTGTKVYAVHGAGYKVAGLLAGDLKVKYAIAPLGVIGIASWEDDIMGAVQAQGIWTYALGEREFVPIDAATDIVTEPL